MLKFEFYLLDAWKHDVYGLFGAGELSMCDGSRVGLLMAHGGGVG